MSTTVDQIRKFVTYVKSLRGDEKGEAQVFCDRLFQAFGHGGYKEAGAILEDRVKRRGKHTGFADLVWRPRLLIEMKSVSAHINRFGDYELNLARAIAPPEFDLETSKTEPLQSAET